MKYLNDRGLSHLISKIGTELRVLRKEFIENNMPDPSTWEGVRAIVRNGRASDFFSIGDQFVCNHADFGEIVWDIIGIDEDLPADAAYTHSLTLQTHDLLTNACFNEPDAVYYAQEGLVPGEYWINFKEKTGEEVAITFTLTSPVPSGGIVCLSWGLMEDLNSATFDTYASQESTQFIEWGNLSYGQTGTQLTPIGNQASFCYGNNRWIDSDIRKYLNSTEEKGAVWYPTSTLDHTPQWIKNYGGFLKGLDADFASVLGTVRVREFDSAQGTFSETEDKVFLPSKGQIYGAVNENEDPPYTYYLRNASTEGPSDAPNTGRIKLYNGEKNPWWLRSAEKDTNLTYVAEYNGHIASTLPRLSGYIAPACCII